MYRLCIDIMYLVDMYVFVFVVLCVYCLCCCV